MSKDSPMLMYTLNIETLLCLTLRYITDSCIWLCIEAFIINVFLILHVQTPVSLCDNMAVVYN